MTVALIEVPRTSCVPALPIDVVLSVPPAKTN